MQKMETKVIGGYNVGEATVYNSQGPLKSADLAALTCSKCEYILREPKQVTLCGHRYCKQCMEQMTSGSDGPYSCCMDKEKFQLQEVFQDKGCLREILGLEVDCPTQPDPCNWRGKLSEMEIHKEMCPNKKFLCAHGCGRYVLENDLEIHMSSECPKRPSTCKYCKKSFPLDSMQDHCEVCEECPVTCDCCCKDLLTCHLEQECDEYDITCPHNDCPFKGQKSDVLQRIFIAHFIRFIQRIEIQLEKVSKKMQDTMIQNATATVRLRRDLSSLKEDVEMSRTQLMKVNESIQTMQNSLTRRT